MKLNIMGSEWTIEERSEKDDSRLNDCDGYADWTTREIVIVRFLIAAARHRMQSRMFAMIWRHRLAIPAI